MLVQQITGISNEMVRAAPLLEAVLPEFLDFLRDAILHSAAPDVDNSFLASAVPTLLRYFALDHCKSQL